MNQHQPLAQESEDETCREARVPTEHDKTRNIIQASLLVACLWWFFGLYTVVTTRSLAVLASLVDATIDLMAQGVLLGANSLAENGRVDSSFPLGVSRLEPIGVVICAVLMTIGSGMVIYDALFSLVHYFPDGPDMHFTIPAAVLLTVVVLVKIVVWQVAKYEYERSKSIALEALALDNFNDILSNASSLAFASLTTLKPWTWWFDPVGGILISLYIIRSWGLTATEQVSMLVGIQADEEFLDEVNSIATKHCTPQESDEDDPPELDQVRAYHFGPKCIVEIKLIMKERTELHRIREVTIKLQDEIEHLGDCERCFVQVDFQHRDEDDHDNNVPLKMKTSGSTENLTNHHPKKMGLRLRTATTLLPPDLSASVSARASGRDRAKTSGVDGYQPGRLQSDRPVRHRSSEPEP